MYMVHCIAFVSCIYLEMILEVSSEWTASAYQRFTVFDSWNFEVDISFSINYFAIALKNILLHAFFESMESDLQKFKYENYLCDFINKGIPYSFTI